MQTKHKRKQRKQRKMTEQDKENDKEAINKAYGLMARIKLMIDEFYRNKADEDTIDTIEEQELLGDIYNEIDKALPKKYLITERLELDEKEQKILKSLKAKW